MVLEASENMLLLVVPKMLNNINFPICNEIFFLNLKFDPGNTPFKDNTSLKTIGKPHLLSNLLIIHPLK